LALVKRAAQAAAVGHGRETRVARCRRIPGAPLPRPTEELPPDGKKKPAYENQRVVRRAEGIVE
jgi:hypothetical protein